MDEHGHHTIDIPTFADAFSDLVTVKLDSCHSTWYFQPARMRFRRSLRGPGIPPVTTGWRIYHGLRFDDAFDGFTVLLNPEGTRLARGYCHQPGSDVCENCADDPPELSLGDISQFVGE